MPGSWSSEGSGCPLSCYELLNGEAVVGSLWCASLCPEGCFGLFFGSEAVVGWQRKASLEKLAGNRWFWGSGADVWMLRKASLGEGWWYLQEWFWRGGSGGTERRFVVEDMERRT